MYYSVYVDGSLLFSTDTMSRTPYVTDATLSMSDNSAGSLELTLLPKCPITIQRMKSHILVKRDGEDLWEGRALSEDIDFYNRSTYHFEGELAYLLDSIQPKRTFSGTVRGFLEELINFHNSRVDSDKQFVVGAVTAHGDDEVFSVEINFESTLDLITSVLINSEVASRKGHIRIRRVNGVRHLDYLADYPSTSTQTIQFAENLLDFTQNFELSDLATVIIPVGNLGPDDSSDNDGGNGDANQHTADIVVDFFPNVESIGDTPTYQYYRASKERGVFNTTVSVNDVDSDGYNKQYTASLAITYPKTLDLYRTRGTASGILYFGTACRAIDNRKSALRSLTNVVCATQVFRVGSSYAPMYSSPSNILEKDGEYTLAESYFSSIGSNSQFSFNDLYSTYVLQLQGFHLTSSGYYENVFNFQGTFSANDEFEMQVAFHNYEGPKDEELSDDEDDSQITIADVNDGSMYLESTDLISLYGRVEKVIDFGEVADASELLEKAKEWFTNQQFDDVCITVNVLDLHYTNPNIEPFNLLDRVRCVSKPHGMDRFFPITEIDINLLSASDTTITLNYSEKIGSGISSANARINEEIDARIKALPSETRILDMAKRNATEIMNMATNGYITIVKNERDGHAEAIVISETQDWKNSERLWKWNMNGFAYSKDGGETWGLAMTMDGSIVADFITAGTMSADRLQGGTLKLGGLANYNGVLEIYDEDNILIGKWDVNGISLLSGKKKNLGIEIANGRFITYRDDVVTGYITGNAHITDDGRNLDGYGVRLAGRTGLILRGPVIGASPEFLEPGESGIYDGGGLGTINVITDIALIDGALQTTQKTLRFTNGLMTSAIDGTGTSSTWKYNYTVSLLDDNKYVWSAATGEKTSIKAGSLRTTSGGIVTLKTSELWQDKDKTKPYEGECREFTIKLPKYISFSNSIDRAMAEELGVYASASSFVPTLDFILPLVLTVNGVEYYGDINTFMGPSIERLMTDNLVKFDSVSYLSKDDPDSAIFNRYIYCFHHGNANDYWWKWEENPTFKTIILDCRDSNAKPFYAIFDSEEFPEIASMRWTLPFENK